MDKRFEKYDSVFSGILQNEGDIMNFLDAFFSFLYRRTDFFAHLLTPTGKLGFRPGVAKKMILEVFKRYENLAAAGNKKLLKQLTSSNATVNKTDNCDRNSENNIDSNLSDVETKSDALENVKTATHCDEGSKDSLPISTITSDTSSTISTISINNSTIPTASLAGNHSASSSINKATPLADVEALISDCKATSKAPLSVNKNSDIFDKDQSVNTISSTDDSNNDEKDDTLADEQKIFQSKSESYNGAIRENYSWSQSIKEVDVYVKVPSYIQSGKQVTVKISKRHLLVSFKNDLGNSTVLKIDDDLNWDVNKEESLWTLVPGQNIHINIEKIEERWWEHLLDSEPRINVRKIDASRPMSDLDEEAQSKIDELMFNDQQKKLGLPQSHEKKMHDILKTAWNVEGSPFQGQPYDPSIVNMQNKFM